MPERSTYAPGTFCWVELATPDAAAAKRFYTALFGWVARDVPPSGEYRSYTMLALTGRCAAAMQELAASPPHWASFVSVVDADDIARRAEQAGGQIVRAPIDVADAGRMAVLADPSGAQFHVWQPRERTGAAVVDEPGAFCWNELATDDIAACRAFYIAVFGWTPLTTQADKTEYTTFKREDAPLCGMLSTTPEWPRRGGQRSNAAGRAAWMTYFAVADCDDSARRAAVLGGELLVPPTDIPPVGRFAVIQDPQGAVFSIVELIDPPTRDAPKE
jgi:predicted enzyme related to lactoylglutathione lyase